MCPGFRVAGKIEPVEGDWGSAVRPDVVDMDRMTRLPHVTGVRYMYIA